MKRGGVTREEIVRASRELIARHGIRAVRVDEIARKLGISKRTLYELFADKTDLVNACLYEMGQEHRQTIVREITGSNADPLQRALRLTDEFIESLFAVDRNFLDEIRGKRAFADHYEEQRVFWRDTFVRLSEEALQKGYLLTGVPVARFAEHIMNALLDLRQQNASPEELHFFGRTMLRGIATRPGIERIDNRA